MSGPPTLLSNANLQHLIIAQPAEFGESSTFNLSSKCIKPRWLLAVFGRNKKGAMRSCKESVDGADLIRLKPRRTAGKKARNRRLKGEAKYNEVPTV